jgi:stage V sporulation protein SpoVS
MSTSPQNDLSILKVKGEGNFQDDQSRKEYVKALSSAILTVVSKHGHARLKTVGASSGNNAWKAIIIARGEALKKGIDLVVEPSFDSASFDTGDKTAIVLRVIPRK